MASSSLSPQENPLAVEKVSKLIAKFGIPSIVSFLVSALYKKTYDGRDAEFCN